MPPYPLLSQPFSSLYGRAPHHCHYEGVGAIPDDNGRYCHCPVKHNLSDAEDLVTVMWASEMLDKNKPDTYFEKV